MSNSLRRLPARLVTCVFALALLVQPVPAQAPTGEESPEATALREMVEALAANDTLMVAGHRIGAPTFMQAFYGERYFEPAWLASKNRRDLIAAVEAAPADGLIAEDFYLDDLRRLRSLDDGSPGEMASRDILFTAALVRLGGQLHSGKVDPASLDSNWNLDRPLFDGDPAARVAEAVAKRDLPRLIANWRPRSLEYQRLRAALAEERARIGAAQVEIAAGPMLEPGDRGERVADLRARLGVPLGSRFDDAVAEAVRAFQTRHHLKPDGIVGPRTLAALNRRPADRVATLRVNLERARWLRGLETLERFVAVNIAGFRVYLIEDRRIVWQARAIVGETYHKTPLFRADMKYIVLNPTWTVPPSIVRRTLLPKIERDPGYLAAHNYVVYDGAGNWVDPTLVDASTFRRYRIVQQPDPRNALGAVKFIFPNRHWVYMHDTPNRALFEKAERTFSAGCIRVENPLELARRLLSDQPEWRPQTIRAVVAGGEMKTAYLKRPIPVLLLYWTADPLGDADQIRYIPDVYDRDGAILEALDAPPDPSFD